MHSKFSDTEPSAWVELKACAANFAHMDDPGARLDLGGVRSAGAPRHRPLPAHSGGSESSRERRAFRLDAEIPTVCLGRDSRFLSAPVSLTGAAAEWFFYRGWYLPEKTASRHHVSTCVLPETQRPPPAFHVYFILPADNRRPNIRFLFHPLLRRLISPL